MLALLPLLAAAGPLSLVSSRQVRAACDGDQAQCAQTIARALIGHGKSCYGDGVESQYDTCMREYCAHMCAKGKGVDTSCGNFCLDKAAALFPKLAQLMPKSTSAPAAEAPAAEAPAPEGALGSTVEKPLKLMTKAEIQAQAREAANEMNSAMDEMHVAQAREKAMAERLSKEAAAAGDTEEGRRKAATASEMTKDLKAIDAHLGKISRTMGLAKAMGRSAGVPTLLQGGKQKPRTMAALISGH